MFAPPDRAARSSLSPRLFASLAALCVLVCTMVALGDWSLALVVPTVLFIGFRVAVMGRQSERVWRIDANPAAPRSPLTRSHERVTARLPNCSHLT